MAKFSEKFEDGLISIAEKVDDNQYLSAIKNAFTVYMPFIMIGSFATLLNTLVCSTTAGLAKFIPSLSSISPAFTAINFATMSFMAIPIVYLIAMNLARHDKLPDQLTGAAALCAYIAVVPQAVTMAVEGIEQIVSGSGIPTSALGAQGLFIGMLIAIVGEKLFGAFMKIDKIKIKMPPSVPAMISQSFNTLIPILLTLVLIGVAGQLVVLTSGNYINELIYTVIQALMEAIFQSPVGIIGIVIISQVFWFLGIHGGLIISPVRNPLCMAAVAANTSALAAGLTPNQPVTAGFWIAFVTVGGAGMILSLLIAIFIFSKRSDHRMIAKLSIVPAICGISEPVVFGLPLVLNPTFAIPFIFNSGIATGIAMLATNIGFMPCNTVDVPFGIPVLFNAFVGHGWQGVVVQFIILVVTTIVWIPFVLMSNKEAKKSEVEKEV